MLRYESIEDISDGRTYGVNDMARLDTHGCAGCSKCCESDMGISIQLDPYDIYNLSRATGKDFDTLLCEFRIELSMVDGIVLPNMKMDKGCTFLENKRCTIHPYRPSICRLFPLGRIYQGDDFSYILQTGECQVEDRAKVKVSKWINIENYEAHAAFIKKWHKFLGMERRKVEEVRTRYSASESEEEYDGEETAKEVMKAVLGWFYLDRYDTEKDFYAQFNDRLRGCVKEFRSL